MHIPAESHRQTEQHGQQRVHTVGHEYGFITPEFSVWEKIWVSSLFCPLLPLRLSMMDLVVAMAPSVDAATMTKTFELIKPFLEVRVHTVSLNVLYISKSKHFLLASFLFVFRPRIQACRRRRIACWRRCAEERETSAGRLSWPIWKRSKRSCSRLWKTHLRQQRGWDCCVESNKIKRETRWDYILLIYCPVWSYLPVFIALSLSRDWSVWSTLWNGSAKNTKTLSPLCCQRYKHT